MSRIFKLNFNFRKKTYTALVSLKTIGYDLSFLVRYLDKELSEIIPGGKLMFHLSGIVEGADMDSLLAKELLSCTSDAISGYLKLEDAI